MSARCRLLANRITINGPILFRCPTTPLKFHYHGTDPSQPYNLLVQGKPCTHRHETQDAARRCTVSKA